MRVIVFLLLNVLAVGTNVWYGADMAIALGASLMSTIACAILEGE